MQEEEGRDQKMGLYLQERGGAHNSDRPLRGSSGRYSALMAWLKKTPLIAKISRQGRGKERSRAAICGGEGREGRKCQ